VAEVMGRHFSSPSYFYKDSAGDVARPPHLMPTTPLERIGAVIPLSPLTGIERERERACPRLEHSCFCELLPV